VTGPTALSTVDLTGSPDGAGGTLECQALPLDEISKWGSRAVRILDKLLPELIP